MSATISFYKEPYDYNPINATTWVVAYSDDYVIEDYKYVYNLYSYNRLDSSDYTFLGQYKLPPRITGEGIWDLHKILKANLDSYSPPIEDITAFTSSIIPVDDDSAMIKFRYGYGFEENISFTFSSTFQQVVGATGYLGLSFSQSYVPYIKAGDIINIQMNPASNNQIYNGVALITSIVTATSSVYTNVLFGETESNSSGMIVSTKRIVGTSSFKYGINGSRQYFDPSFNNLTNQSGLSDLYTNNKFILKTTGTESNFLTNYSGYKNIFTNQYEIATLISVTQSNYNMEVKTYDINLNLITTYTLPSKTLYLDYQLYNVPVGTANLQGLSGISLATASYYDVKITNGSQSAIIKRKIISNCSPYTNVRIMFLNRVGGYDFYNFNYDSKISVNIERKEFNRTIDWNYNVGDRGRSILSIDANSQTIINSDWISEYDYLFLQELITSTECYVINESLNLKLPIIITDSTWEQKTQIRDKIFNMVITFKYAYDINLQSN